MSLLPTQEIQIKDLLQDLIGLTQAYWVIATGTKPSPIIHVPWNMGVVYPRLMMDVESKALNCLKKFDVLFVKQRHIDIVGILKFSEFATQLKIAYKEIVLINYEIETGSVKEKIDSRHYKFDFEFDNCLISFYNDDFVPCISLNAISTKRKSLPNS